MTLHATIIYKVDNKDLPIQHFMYLHVYFFKDMYMYHIRCKSYSYITSDIFLGKNHAV